MTQLTTELSSTQQHHDAIREAIAKHAFALYESEGFKDGTIKITGSGPNVSSHARKPQWSFRRKRLPRPFGSR